MTRRLFFAVLLCLALVEIGLFVDGCRSSNRPDPATVQPRVGPQNDALPAALTAPTLSLEPDAGFQWLYSAVNNAKGTIDMTMYELVDTTFSGDLVQACQRGVKVRVILDQNREKASNTPAYNQLSAAGPNCSVAWANPQFQATHQKTIILDGHTAVVMTFNLTTRYYASSRDMALIDTDAADISAIQSTFEKDFKSTTDKTYQPRGGHNLIWSPTAAEQDLVSLISTAKSTLVLENEELGASSIVDALTAACKRGVKVSLAMTDTSANYHPNYQALEAAGCGVHIGANNASTLYIHAKAIVADLGTADAIGYVGSINFSNASMTENRELGLYVHDAKVLSQLASTMASDYIQFPAYSAKLTLPNTESVRP